MLLFEPPRLPDDVLEAFKITLRLRAGFEIASFAGAGLGSTVFRQSDGSILKLRHAARDDAEIRRREEIHQVDLLSRVNLPGIAMPRLIGSGVFRQILTVNRTSFFAYDILSDVKGLDIGRDRLDDPQALTVQQNKTLARSWAKTAFLFHRNVPKPGFDDKPYQQDIAYDFLTRMQRTLRHHENVADEVGPFVASLDQAFGETWTRQDQARRVVIHGDLGISNLKFDADARVIGLVDPGARVSYREVEFAPVLRLPLIGEMVLDYYDRIAKQHAEPMLDRELVHIVGLTRYLSVIVRNYAERKNGAHLEGYRGAANVSFDYLGKHATAPDFRRACQAAQRHVAAWPLSQG